MPLFHQHIQCNKKIIIMKATFLIPAILSPFATASPLPDDNIAQLEEINVTANISEISTNSKIIKNSEQLEKQQVNNIRDLIRYDAGVSVVEQNRGGTSGFAIRGVDKNRVAITVDGIPQLQSHTTNISDFYEPVGSGARNEVELENISSVEIDKGSQSFQARNGALGGSVNFKTKSVDDILSEGEKFALTSKTAYSSKNSQFMQSLGTAFHIGHLKGLFQYTHRHGKETKIHDDVMNKKIELRRLGAYVDKYRLSTPIPNEVNTNGIFYKCETCTEPFYLSRFTRFHDLKSAMDDYKDSNKGREFTPEELEQLKQMVHPTEIVSAKDYTGPDREAPDPLKSKTHSYLTRLEYEITPNQLIGGIFEDTKQRYATRDMKERAYYYVPPPPPSVPDPRPKYPRAPTGDGFYCKDCPEGYDWDGYYKAFDEYKKKLIEFREKKKEYDKSGVNTPEDKAWKAYDELKREYDQTIRDFVNQIPHPGSGGAYLDDIAMGPYAPLAYTKTRFSTEEHRKQRQSLYYIIEPKNKWADKLEFNLDLQKISIDSDYRTLSCSKYPVADKNCRASRDKPGSSEDLDNVFYQEKRSHLGLKYDKTFQFEPITYRINMTAGATRYQVTQNHHAYVMRYGGLENELRPNKNGGRYEIYIPHHLGRVDSRDLLTADVCSKDRRCSFKLKGKNKYFGLYNQISFGKYLDIGGGFLRDRDSVSGDKKFLVSREYDNTTYKFNVMLKPIEQIHIAYHYSTGFRNPSSQEVYGWSPHGKRSTAHLKPETSTHHEVSVGFKGNWGYLEANKFISSYKNLISLATERESSIRQDYNFSNATIEGYGIQGYLDLHSIMQIIPSGFSTNITYEKSKPKKATRIDDRLIHGTLYPFDAIQPDRVVIGLNYDAPSEKWGSSLIMTYSKAKDANELATTRFLAKDPNHPNNKFKVTHIETESWKTIDLLGYYKVGKNITVNAGIYNLLNKQYSTWESVRRSSTNSVHAESQYGSIARYAAPGRNYFVSLNMKF
ncbi:hypothetical protein BKK49_07510 [Rodentibacter rarus]|uniref:TonB-dependent hemoglobin/transferrin/lactoferrin family receptor n=1 Tax=Rodentibacter rarus TaxID=1908260 RepID=UPI00098787C4|nr:TonB-dependent hemoglobin/transferrin/lactoferrin family receptor [Rodentibacter rarus]OOF39685.1 hypothetical protein BKK49_07510 [Rodentibacter rarus]